MESHELTTHENGDHDGQGQPRHDRSLALAAIASLMGNTQYNNGSNSDNNNINHNNNDRRIHTEWVW